MKNLVQASPTNDGTKHLELTASGADVASGEFKVIGQFPCVAVADVADGESGTFLVEQVISYAKGAVAFAEGQAVYFDGSQMTDTDGGGSNDLVGHAVKAAIGGDAEVVFKMAAYIA
jgi:predicted RecA/RadA family phage recombinase